MTQNKSDQQKPQQPTLFSAQKTQIAIPELQKYLQQKGVNEKIQQGIVSSISKHGFEIWQNVHGEKNVNKLLKVELFEDLVVQCKGKQEFKDLVGKVNEKLKKIGEKEIDYEAFKKAIKESNGKTVYHKYKQIKNQVQQAKKKDEPKQPTKQENKEGEQPEPKVQSTQKEEPKVETKVQTKETKNEVKVQQKKQERKQQNKEEKKQEKKPQQQKVQTKKNDQKVEAKTQQKDKPKQQKVQTKKEEPKPIVQNKKQQSKPQPKSARPPQNKQLKLTGVQHTSRTEQKQKSQHKQQKPIENKPAQIESNPPKPPNQPQSKVLDTKQHQQSASQQKKQPQTKYQQNKQLKQLPQQKEKGKHQQSKHEQKADDNNKKEEHKEQQKHDKQSKNQKVQHKIEPPKETGKEQPKPKQSQKSQSAVKEQSTKQLTDLLSKYFKPAKVAHKNTQQSSKFYVNLKHDTQQALENVLNYCLKLNISNNKKIEAFSQIEGRKLFQDINDYEIIILKIYTKRAEELEQSFEAKIKDKSIDLQGIQFKTYTQDDKLNIVFKLTKQDQNTFLTKIKQTIKNSKEEDHMNLQFKVNLGLGNPGKEKPQDRKLIKCLARGFDLTFLVESSPEIVSNFRKNLEIENAESKPYLFLALTKNSQIKLKWKKIEDVNSFFNKLGILQATKATPSIKNLLSEGIKQIYETEVPSKLKISNILQKLLDNHQSHKLQFLRISQTSSITLSLENKQLNHIIISK